MNQACGWGSSSESNMAEKRQQMNRPSSRATATSDLSRVPSPQRKRTGTCPCTLEQLCKKISSAGTSDLEILLAIQQAASLKLIELQEEIDGDRPEPEALRLQAPATDAFKPAGPEDLGLQAPAPNAFKPAGRRSPVPSPSP